MSPVRELFCRRAACGRVQNTGRDRGPAPLNTSYSNTTSASSSRRNQTPPHRGRNSPPLPSSSARRAPSASSRRPLPPAASSCGASTPRSSSRPPSCPGNGARSGALAGRRKVAAVGQFARSYLAELVQLLKQLIVINKKINKTEISCCRKLLGEQKHMILEPKCAIKGKDSLFYF